MVASRSRRFKPLRRRAAATPTAPARSSGPAIFGIMLLVALAVQGAAAAHGGGLAFVPAAPVVQAGHRWAGGGRGRGRQRVVTASSVQEPPRSSVPRSGSGEEEEGGGGSSSNGGLDSVLSSLAKQRRLPPISGASWGVESSEQPGQPQGQGQGPREPVLASTPQPFSLETAVLLAPFAFEAYNDPARTEGTSW